MNWEKMLACFTPAGITGVKAWPISDRVRSKVSKRAHPLFLHVPKGENASASVKEAVQAPSENRKKKGETNLSPETEADIAMNKARVESKLNEHNYCPLALLHDVGVNYRREVSYRYKVKTVRERGERKK